MTSKSTTVALGYGRNYCRDDLMRAPDAARAREEGRARQADAGRGVERCRQPDGRRWSETTASRVKPTRSCASLARTCRMGVGKFATLESVDWFNHRRLLEPIGNMPPAEAEKLFSAAPGRIDMAACGITQCRRQTRAIHAAVTRPSNLSRPRLPSRQRVLILGLTTNTIVSELVRDRWRHSERSLRISVRADLIAFTRKRHRATK